MQKCPKKHISVPSVLCPVCRVHLNHFFSHTHVCWPGWPSPKHLSIQPDFYLVFVYLMNKLFFTLSYKRAVHKTNGSGQSNVLYYIVAVHLNHFFGLLRFCSLSPCKLRSDISRNRPKYDSWFCGKNKFSQKRVICVKLRCNVSSIVLYKLANLHWILFWHVEETEFFDAAPLYQAICTYWERKKDWFVQWITSWKILLIASNCTRR